MQQTTVACAKKDKTNVQSAGYCKVLWHSTQRSELAGERVFGFLSFLPSLPLHRSLPRLSATVQYPTTVLVSEIRTYLVTRIGKQPWSTLFRRWPRNVLLTRLVSHLTWLGWRRPIREAACACAGPGNKNTAASIRCPESIPYVRSSDLFRQGKVMDGSSYRDRG